MLEFLQLEIPDAQPGIEATVAKMLELTRDATLDPIVRSTAIRLVRGAADPIQLIQRVRNFCSRIQTRIMEYPEMLHPPDWVLRHRGSIDARYGDCDDHAMMAAALLLSLGMQTRFVVLQLAGNPNDGHVFTEVETSYGWLPIDPAIPFGYAPPAGYQRVMEEYV